jgi:O-acetyl-ADP-ribose deacetylase (regulator of RNase III)
MNIVQQNILDVTGPAVICHQVNCRRLMGAGLALDIRHLYPEVHKAYVKKDDWRLGDCQIVKIYRGGYIANLAGQEDVGPGICRTDYTALRNALRVARDFANANSLTLYIPYGIGCGLAGGDWKIVSSIIEEHAPDAVICQLPS